MGTLGTSYVQPTVSCHRTRDSSSLRRRMGAMRVLVGVGTVGGATVMTVTSLVRQSVTRELPAKHQMEEEEGRKVSLRQEGWCLIKDALTPGRVAESNLPGIKRSDLQLLFSL